MSLGIDVLLMVSGKNTRKSDGFCHCCFIANWGVLRFLSKRLALKPEGLPGAEKKLPSGWLVPLGILPIRPRYSFVRS